MADVKISELTALTSANVDSSGDVLAVVDTSASATRKITIENLLSPITINKSTDVITDLGTVTTADINGGTWAGAIDGAWTAAGVTCANLGTVSAATSITSTAFVGDITGDVTGTAAVATAVTVADESTDTTCFPLFATAATGNLPPKSGSNLTFNSSSGLLTSTLFAGALTGNVTGNASGTALTVTQAAQSAITSVGTLTGLTLSGNITMGDDTSIGISDSDERIEFDVAGDISVLGANFGIGTAAPDEMLHVKTTANASEYIKIENDDTMTTLGVSSDGYSTLTYEGSLNVAHWDGSTWSGNKLVIDSSGNVGIGVAPSCLLDLRGSTTPATRLFAIGTDSTATTFSVNSAGTAAATYAGNGNAVVNIGSATSGNLEVSLKTTGSCELAAIAGSNVTVVAGNLVIGTSGKGIDFSNAADTATGETTTSSLLDDYEEGTWSPNVGGNASYTNQTGTYTKVGRMVNVSLELHINVIGTGSTSIISGLPFTAQASPNYSSSGAIGYASGLAINVLALTFRVDQGGSNIYNTNLTSASSTTSDSQAIFGNSARVLFDITYPAA